MTTILYFFMKFLQEKWKIKKSKASMVPIILLLLEGNTDHGEFSGRNKTMLPSLLFIESPCISLSQ